MKPCPAALSDLSPLSCHNSFLMGQKKLSILCDSSVGHSCRGMSSNDVEPLWHSISLQKEAISDSLTVGFVIWEQGVKYWSHHSALSDSSQVGLSEYHLVLDRDSVSETLTCCYTHLKQHKTRFSHHGVLRPHGSLKPITVVLNWSCDSCKFAMSQLFSWFGLH